MAQVMGVGVGVVGGEDADMTGVMNIEACMFTRRHTCRHRCTCHAGTACYRRTATQTHTHTVLPAFCLPASFFLLTHTLLLRHMPSIYMHAHASMHTHTHTRYEHKHQQAHNILGYMVSPNMPHHNEDETCQT